MSTFENTTSGCSAWILARRSSDQGVDRHVAGALGAHDAEGDDRLVVEPRECALLRRRVLDRSQFIQANLAPPGQRNRQGREVPNRVRARERADRLFLARDLAASAAQVDVVGLDLRIDRGCGHAERQQLLRIERDANFAIDAAGAAHRADALHGLQFARDRVVDEPGKLLRRQARRRGGVGDERQAFDIDAAR